MRGLVGVLGWLGQEGRLVFPFMQLVHKWQLWVGKVGRNKLLLSMIPQVVKALGFIHRPVRFPSFQMKGWRRFASFSSIWFVDAASSVGKFGVVRVLGCDVTFLSLPLPKSMQQGDLNSQQQAELFSIKSCVSLAKAEGFQWGPDCLLVSDSQSSSWSCLNLNVGDVAKQRGRLLRQLVDVIVDGMGAVVAFCPGSVMPADPPSRLGGGFSSAEFCLGSRQYGIGLSISQRLNFVLSNPACLAWSREDMSGHAKLFDWEGLMNLVCPLPQEQQPRQPWT